MVTEYHASMQCDAYHALPAGDYSTSHYFGIQFHATCLADGHLTTSMPLLPSTGELCQDAAATLSCMEHEVMLLHMEHRRLRQQLVSIALHKSDAWVQ